VFRKGTPETARPLLIGASLGVMTALKLLIRLETRGSVVLTGAPEGIEMIEEFSDELATEYFDKVAGEALGAGNFEARLGTARFARTEDTMTFRLAPLQKSEDVVSPELHDVKTLREIAEEVVAGLSALLDRTLRPLRGSGLVHGRISLIIGFTAAAKVLMAYWGPGILASGIETLSEFDSERRYRELAAADQGLGSRV
jgi:hypothetical protein